MINRGGATSAGEDRPAVERGVVPHRELAQARLLGLAERFLRRQLDLVGGVIEEVTLKNALYRMGIDWRFVAEILDRPEYAAIYERTPHGPVRMVGLRPAIETRHRSPKRRPLRVSQPYFPKQTRRPAGLLGMTPLKRFFLALLEIARNWPIYGVCDWLQDHGWAEALFKPIQVRHPQIDQHAPGWHQRLQHEAFSVGLIQEYNEAVEELWGFDPVLTREFEDLACRPLRYDNPYSWLQGAWVDDEDVKPG